MLSKNFWCLPWVMELGHKKNIKALDLGIAAYRSLERSPRFLDNKMLSQIASSHCFSKHVQT